jgi:hypothetical protein
MFIVGRDAAISVERSGQPAQRMELHAGEFEWHTGPMTHSITNVGKMRFEAIEAVWK